MGFELIFSMLIAYYFTRNLTQDITWAARNKGAGGDPPSFRRQQDRIARRDRMISQWQERRQPSANAKQPGPARRYFAHAYGDAVSTAEEHRERRRTRRADKRHAKWEAKDQRERDRTQERKTQEPQQPPATAGDPPKTPAADEERPAKKADSDIQRGKETVVHSNCVRCGTPVDTNPLSSSHRTVPLCRACLQPDREPADWQPAEQAAANTTPKTGEDHHYACQTCGRPIIASAEDFRTTSPGMYPAPLCTSCGGRFHPAEPSEEETPAKTGEPGPPAAAQATDTPDHDGVVLPFPQPLGNQTISEVTATTKEEEMSQMTESGETTNLSAALNYTSNWADNCAQGFSSVELSLAGLTEGQVGGAALTHLGNAQELLQQLQTEFTAAHAALQNHLQVREAYEATGNQAGDKDFVTQD